MSGDYEDKPQPLIEHLMELRTRLIWSIAAFFAAFIICFFFAKQIFNVLVYPYKWAVVWAKLDIANAQLIYTAPQEFFFTQVKVAMFGALVISFPIIAAQIYKFVAPGLYKNERSAFLPFLIASPILFLMGAALVYFFFTPMVMWFFLTMQQKPENGEVAISLLPKVSEYLSLITTLVLSFGFVFQLPVVTTLLARVGLLTSQWLAEKRKYAIVLAFVVAAVLTPPDPMSQIGLAIPTIILYEIAIHAARLVERQRAREEAERQAGAADVVKSDDV
ncbi:twin-arginine translocase subunit TatC [Oryzifoliimicrobium ureilyticus]|uniref:twin-arginine translocase subunit TatC n=1 Tax=Oryzifoliimicrobium ureilyticus TaxID=3113724 RepID=UPI00307671F5